LFRQTGKTRAGGLHAEGVRTVHPGYFLYLEMTDDIEERRGRRDEPYLARPLGELAGREALLRVRVGRRGLRRSCCRRGAVELAHRLAGASVRRGRPARERHSASLHLLLHLRHLPFLHGLLVIRRRVALDNPYRTRRAFREAVAHAVAVVVLDEPRLAVHDGDCALVAGVRAQPAPVALRLVDLDYLSFVE
jgi:hypothetical protein